ncbi:MAG: hypothetical protein ACLPYB_02055 [Desulfobaccales bacterium]
MLGLSLLVRLGRRVLAGPVAGSGLLPTACYRHLALAAMEEEDFPGALDYLRWVEDPMLAQLLVLRLRLLAEGHGRRCQVLSELLPQAPAGGTREKGQALLLAEERALKVLRAYEARALGLLGQGAKPAGAGRLAPDHPCGRPGAPPGPAPA